MASLPRDRAGRGGVIGAKGTLPPKGDQSLVPTWAKDRADVVGEPAELGALLTQIAASLVATPPAPAGP
jgi:hypothetical protein